MVKGRTGTRTLRCGAVALLTVLAAPAAVAGTNAMSGAGTVGDCGGESVTAYRQYRLENTATGVRVARGGNTLWNLEIDNPEGRPFFHPLSLKRGETLELAYRLAIHADRSVKGTLARRPGERTDSGRLD